MNPARKRATYADLLQVPERFVAEIIDGELTTAPRAVLSPRPCCLFRHTRPWSLLPKAGWS